jgi:hypothetical protein
LLLDLLFSSEEEETKNNVFLSLGISLLLINVILILISFIHVVNYNNEINKQYIKLANKTGITKELKQMKKKSIQNEIEESWKKLDKQYQMFKELKNKKTSNASLNEIKLASFLYAPKTKSLFKNYMKKQGKTIKDYTQFIEHLNVIVKPLLHTGLLISNSIFGILLLAIWSIYYIIIHFAPIIESKIDNFQKFKKHVYDNEYDYAYFVINDPESSSSTPNGLVFPLTTKLNAEQLDRYKSYKYYHEIGRKMFTVHQFFGMYLIPSLIPVIFSFSLSSLIHVLVRQSQIKKSYISIAKKKGILKDLNKKKKKELEKDIAETFSSLSEKYKAFIKK